MCLRVVSDSALISATSPPDVISLATVSLQWLHDNQLDGLVNGEPLVERGCQADMLSTWSLASIRSIALLHVATSSLSIAST